MRDINLLNNMIWKTQVTCELSYLKKWKGKSGRYIYKGLLYEVWAFKIYIGRFHNFYDYNMNTGVIQMK